MKKNKEMNFIFILWQKLHSMGRQQRTKQKPPNELPGASPYQNTTKGKKKANLEARAEREGTTKTGRVRKDTKGRVTGGFSAGRTVDQGPKPIKKVKKSKAKAVDEDDIEGLEEEDDLEDEELLGEDKDLEAARS